VRALVTGAAGFVGRWLTEALRDGGIAVTALATESDSSAEASAAAPRSTVAESDPGARAPIDWLFGDLRSAAYIANAVDSAPYDYVVHLAAISHVPSAANDPALAWDVNVTATARLLHAVGNARDRGACDPVVLIVGSAEQYGEHGASEGALGEKAELRPHTIYAATKVAQEVLALQVWRATGLKVVVTRSFNHSGAGQNARFVVPALVRRALALRDAPTGAPLLLGNLSPVRDFLHVRDVVAAYISLCQRGTAGEVYNVASGVGRSVQSIVDTVLERVGVTAAVAVDPALARPVDVPVLIGDARKLQHATGWRASRSFDDIIDDLIHAATH
jgi:GDP-4-dehydro-6-deoxy-D-mannose reductase